MSGYRESKFGKAGAVLIVLVVALVISGILVYENREKAAMWLWPDIVDQPTTPPVDEPTIDVEYIKEEISEIAELQTAKVTYGCIAHFEEGKIKFINKKSFKMYYEVTVYATMKLDDIDCVLENGKYIITLPAAKAEIVDVDSKSLKFYDKSGALLNWKEYEDVVAVLSYAEDDAAYQMSTIQMLDVANKNAVDVISNLLNNFLDKDSYEIITSEDSIEYIRPPMSYEDVVGENFSDIKDAFEKAGYKNIKTEELKDISIDISKKENTVESVAIDDHKTFLTSNAYPSDSQVVIYYHSKEK